MTKGVEEIISVAVVDDDISCLNGLVHLLTASGLKVCEFSSARQLLESPECENVACVISDLRMPDMNGLQLQMVLQDKMPHLSILFVTGYGEVPESVSAMKAGAVDFLEKPVKAAVLIEAVQRAATLSCQLKAGATELTNLRTRYESRSEER